MHVALQETDTVRGILYQGLATIYFFQLNKYLMGHQCSVESRVGVISWYNYVCSSLESG